MPMSEKAKKYSTCWRRGLLVWDDNWRGARGLWPGAPGASASVSVSHVAMYASRPPTVNTAMTAILKAVPLRIFCGVSLPLCPGVLFLGPGVVVYLIRLSHARCCRQMVPHTLTNALRHSVFSRVPGDTQ